MITEYIASLFEPRASYQPWDDFWFNPPPVGSDLSGVTSPDAMHVSAFFNGIRILAETVAQPPLILYEKTGDDQKEKATDHPLFEVLHNQPNPFQTSYEFRLLQTMKMLLGGNAYAEQLGGTRSAVEELRPLENGRMHQPKLLANGRLGYMYNDERRGQIPFSQDEIFHVRAFPLSADGITGQSLLTFARSTIGLALSTERYGRRLFDDDAKQRGNYSIPGGGLSQEAIDQLRTQIKRSDGLMILQNGATWVETGMTAADAEFLLTRKFEILEIARWLNIQPHLLKDLDRASFSNIEHQGLEFLQFTMMPYFVNWEQAIRRDLITQPNRFFAEFLVDGLVRADIKTRYEAYGAAIGSGFMVRNQARVKENWNKLPGLDAPLVDQNKATVGPDGKIVPVNKPEGVDIVPSTPDDREEAHYHRLLEGNAAAVMRKDARAMLKEWEKTKDADKLTAWADKFYEDHAHFVAEKMQFDEKCARKFAEDRRDKFLLSVKDNCLRDHVQETEKYGPGQLVRFSREALQ